MSNFLTDIDPMGMDMSNKDEYTLPYCDDVFDSIDDLINAVLTRGIDPNYEIHKNGNPTGDIAFDLITP